MTKINKVLYQAGSRYFNPKEQPMIRIANNYLKEAGFNYGEKIEVEYKKGVIIIRKIAESEKKPKLGQTTLQVN